MGKDKPMCVLTNLDREYLISVEDATALFAILSRARRVKYEYNTSSYVYAKPDSYSSPTLKLLDVVELSKIVMASD